MDSFFVCDLCLRRFGDLLNALLAKVGRTYSEGFERTLDAVLTRESFSASLNFL